MRRWRQVGDDRDHAVGDRRDPLAGAGQTAVELRRLPATGLRQPGGLQSLLETMIPMP